MTQRNRYAHRAKISEARFRRLVRLFAMDLDASQIASVAEVNRNTVNRYLMGLRQRIAAQGHEPPLSHGTGAGTAPVPGPGAARSSLVCGLALVGGRIHTELVDCNGSMPLHGLGRGGVPAEVLARVPALAGFGALVALRSPDRLRWLPAGSGPDRGLDCRDDTLASFWSYARSRLSRFRGLRKAQLPLHLKECEFRFNNRGEDLYKLLLGIVRAAPLF